MLTPSSGPDPVAHGKEVSDSPENIGSMEYRPVHNSWTDGWNGQRLSGVAVTERIVVDSV